MQIKKYLIDFKKEFDPIFFNFLDKKEKQARKLNPDYTEAIQEIKRLNKAGGKRLRPAFVYIGYKACKTKNSNLIWRACLAMELIQTFALIHDDIIDNGGLRRGQITCFKKAGLAKAILIGDTALILADELMPERAKKYFDLMKFELIAGQYLDINKTSQHLVLGGSAAMRIMELKTGMYTIARPLQIGAVLAGADEKTMKAFFDYGKNLGVAFQIQDDILGIFGDEKKIGKSVGSDISEGKKTLLAVRLLKNNQKLNTKDQKHPFGKLKAGKQKIKKFLTFFGKRQKLTKKQLEFTRKLMIKSGALDYCQKKARYLAEKAKRVVKEKEFLVEICEYIIKRRY